jgi:hypothetical protein
MSRIVSAASRRFALLATFVLLVSVPLASASPGGGKDKKSKSKVPANAPAESGTPKLWEDRGDISSLNLYYGIGSEAGAPKPPFKFEKEDVSGTNPKIKVVDANGVRWNMKFDEEVHAEVACSRLAWAAGYMVEESYFVPSGTVEGVGSLGRAKMFVGSNGSFSNAMFEKRPDTIARRQINWDWDSNPFRGTKELSGLAILAVLVNNWDAKTMNNNVLVMYAEDGRTGTSSPTGAARSARWAASCRTRSGTSTRSTSRRSSTACRAAPCG